MRDGKYRHRTALRESLPEFLAALIPKGRQDCGNHEWYKADEHLWRCYHCEPGIAREVPWNEREREARSLEAGAMNIRAGIRRPDRSAVPHH